MPYEDPEARLEYQRQYQRRWRSDRRSDWFKDKVCVECGSADDLELDHVDPALKDPSLKTSSRRGDVWCWAEGRREAELAKCQALCADCHKAKSARDAARGSSAGNAKLIETDIPVIRAALAEGLTATEIARTYGVDPGTIRHIRRGSSSAHV